MRFHRPRHAPLVATVPQRREQAWCSGRGWARAPVDLREAARQDVQTRPPQQPRRSTVEAPQAPPVSPPQPSPEGQKVRSPPQPALESSLRPHWPRTGLAPPPLDGIPIVAAASGRHLVSWDLC
jgi:hypothetical protein